MDAANIGHIGHFSLETKRVAIELWKAKVPLKSWMKQQLRDSTATSLPDLQKEITELWTMKMDDIPYLKALVESMPRRIEDVIRRDGNTTNY